MTADQDDAMMVDETMTTPTGAAPSQSAAGPFPFAPAQGMTSTLVHRPAASALSAAAGPAGPANNLIAALDTLPDVKDMMPTQKQRMKVWDLGESVDRASELAYDSTAARNPGHQQVLTAAGMLRLDHDVRKTKRTARQEVRCLRGYVESLRHQNKKDKLECDGLKALIAKCGTPELKAGIIMAEVKEEKKKLDAEWMEKKKGSEYAEFEYSDFECSDLDFDCDEDE